MRHRKKTVKLGRTSAHRKELLANQVCALIDHKRIKTTLQKARATRVLAEKMVTLGKKGTLAARRRAISKLKQTSSVKELFDTIAPSFEGRSGGYTRIIKLSRRASDNSEMVYLEWVDASETVTVSKTEGVDVEEKSVKAPVEAPVEEVTETVEEEEVTEEASAEEVVEEVAEEDAPEKVEETKAD